MASSGVTVSVALCTRNGARFIAEQVDSILGQTVLPREIVLSDDGSTDSTVEIVQAIVGAFLAANPSVEIDLITLRNEIPLGVAKNFQQAVLACRSELIALCDQDDIWMPHRLVCAVEVFTARPDLLLLHSDAVLIDAAGNPPGGTLFEALEVTAATQQAVHRGEAFSVLLRRNIATGATVMFRRELIAVSTPFAEAWVHDEWLAMVASVTGEVDLLSDRPVRYRQHGSNQIGVQKLGLSGKLARVLEPGGARNSRLLSRAMSLEARFRELDFISDERRKAVHDKLVHEQARSALSPHRLVRVVPIIRELLTGRYGRFGRGLADAGRDLLQSLNAPR